MWPDEWVWKWQCGVSQKIAQTYKKKSELSELCEKNKKHKKY